MWRVTKIIWECLKKITKLKNVIKNVIKIYFPQIYRVCFLEYSFLKLSNIFDIFKKMNSRKPMLQIVNFLILHNSVSWIEETEFSNLNVPCRLKWNFIFEDDDPSFFVLLFGAVLFWKCYRAKSNVTNFGPFLVPSVILLWIK